MSDLTLGIPEAGNEPQPWVVLRWRHRHRTEEPFATREDAYAWAQMMVEWFSEECYIEGVRSPEGIVDTLR